jgi:hypothetical protein
MFFLSNGFSRGFNTIVFVFLVIIALPVLAVIGKLSAHHQDSVYYQTIPNTYVGQWVGNATPIQDPTGVDTPVSGHISVEIPQGM